ncbi:MAG: hypothetical protein IPK97_19085 [Ahniella sp.]|nr:hypothetical protein [Ahniella sp.]
MKSGFQGSRIPVVAMVLMLAGCGQSQEQAAAEACAVGLAERLRDQKFTVDKVAMAAEAKRPDGPDIVEINATATLETGSPAPFLCRVQFDAANPKAPPTLLYVQTNW